MGFILFLILVLLITNGIGGSLFKFMGVCVGFLMAAVGCALFFLVCSFNHHMFPSHVVASEVTIKPQLRSHMSSNQLDSDIAKLRKKIQGNIRSQEKEVLLGHLQILEEIQRQKLDEKEAVRRMKEDARRIRDIKRAKRELVVSKQKITEKSQYLETLEEKLDRSKRLLNKLIESENINKEYEYEYGE